MLKVKKTLLVAGLGLVVASSACFPANAADRFATYANPVDLPYRYQFRSLREAADPTMVWFKDRYWLFASHSKGYWWSFDLLKWEFVEPTGFPVNRYAPTALVMNNRLYMTASENTPDIWTTDDPLTGSWSKAADIRPGYNDPCLFLDDDGRLYMYEGLSGKDVLRVYELDPVTFQPLRKADVPASRNKAQRGWEVVGDNNEIDSAESFVEGAWMTKYQGKYYLQYASPGTEYKTYADGVLTSNSPMGPFKYEPYSPFSFKPTGFAAGAGHSSTFQGADGQWWHIGTMTISKRFKFERRLGLFPASFSEGGALMADTYLGDYPRYIGGKRELTGWMLLSRHKPVTVSSTLEGYPAENASDEDIRTVWSAQTGESTEWLQMDLRGLKTVEAVQLNFADQDSAGRGISRDVYRYVLEGSDDGASWRILIDQSTGGRDAPHDYRVLAKPELVRYIRIKNVHTPDNGKFSLYDLRVFGHGQGQRPVAVGQVTATRQQDDARRASISWKPVKNTDFYIVRLGVEPDLMNQNFQVYDGASTVTVGSLNSGQKYYVAVDAVNEQGITRGKTQLVLP
ncbi:family 43 glycosylhydrolase [Duganella radicis]|uniref:Family 43 glycosylhydrolase n=1 Tax=Duganella radicis TaxID=551988 RepID=A0A6L6PBF5_9BURK|nr:family 43 glycosylhydrolase [Duganella radicis]MTV36294.1 family 43 glycosylhydrolase [Duganella radicis]